MRYDTVSLTFDELKQQLLSQIERLGGQATTGDLLRNMARWRDESLADKPWADRVRWALIHLVDEALLLNPFGNLANGNDQERRKWLRQHRPGETTDQQVWQITDEGRRKLGTVNTHFALSEEVIEDALDMMPEGAVKSVVMNFYERNSRARAACIAHYGCLCAVCGFDFERAYGEIGENYIHVHHVIPLSEIGAQYYVDPVKDLIPVCPNCHAMLHQRTPPLSVDALRNLIEEHRR